MHVHSVEEVHVHGMEEVHVCAWRGGSECAWHGEVEKGPDIPFMIEYSKVRKIFWEPRFGLIILTCQDFLDAV